MALKISYNDDELSITQNNRSQRIRWQDVEIVTFALKNSDPDSFTSVTVDLQCQIKDQSSINVQHSQWLFAKKVWQSKMAEGLIKLMIQKIPGKLDDKVRYFDITGDIPEVKNFRQSQSILKNKIKITLLIFLFFAIVAVIYLNGL